MWTDFVLAIGKFFKWSFQILPVIGPYMDWILAIIGILLLAAWTLELVKLGDGKDEPFEPSDKFPYL